MPRPGDGRRVAKPDRQARTAVSLREECMERKLRRDSLRLPNYDYADVGVYFVTLCTHERQCLFGAINDGTMRLTDLGDIAQACWLAIPSHFQQVFLDTFVMMPNHIHGIIKIGKRINVGTSYARPGAKRATQASPSLSTRTSPLRNVGGLGTIIGSFKSAVSRRVNAVVPEFRDPLWQRNYYEHIIRSESSLRAIREYIMNNPAQWELDRENPNFTGR
jgi:putative transposase